MNVSPESNLISQLTNAIPVAVFVVDDDVDIRIANVSGSPLLRQAAAQAVGDLLGDAIGCVNSTEGCGKSDACKLCIARNSVYRAFNGERIVDEQTTFFVKRDGQTIPIEVSVSAVPIQLDGRMQVVLTMQDITELVALRRLLPVCASCGTDRHSEAYRSELALYMDKNADSLRKHAICESCMKTPPRQVPEQIPQEPKREAEEEDTTNRLLEEREADPWAIPDER